MNRPYAESSEQNKSVIYEVIRPWLKGEILEIGSGTGQHAVYFAGQHPEIIWQPSERAENLGGIQAWIDHAQLDNLLSPIELDVLNDWPGYRYDIAYSANCFHIMGEEAVRYCLRGIAGCLKDAGLFFVYGPFNYHGEYTSDSNRRFDAWLKDQDIRSGIKDVAWLEQVAGDYGLNLLKDVEMPANNRILIWQYRTL